MLFTKWLVRYFFNVFFSCVDIFVPAPFGRTRGGGYVIHDCCVAHECLLKLAEVVIFTVSSL